MILYFSGTGNSKYVAEKIAVALNDELLNINGKIKTNDLSPVSTGENAVAVTPTYAWRIPRIVTDWLLKTRFIGLKKMWFVMTCGGEIGNAEKYNKELCNQMGVEYMGTKQILMPENYIAMFDAPQKNEAIKIVDAAQKDIEYAVEAVSSLSAFPVPPCSLKDRLMSGAVNDVFYPFCVKASAFKADEKCIGCGKCVKVCPLNNITLENGKPKWSDNCTHCMACICHCPTKAVEYGKKSVGKTRYNFESLGIER